MPRYQVIRPLHRNHVEHAVGSHIEIEHEEAARFAHAVRLVAEPTEEPKPMEGDGKQKKGKK